MVGLCLGMLLAAVDQTIVATSIRTISDDLNGYSLQVWATTAYLITSTLTTPLYGKLSDMYGRKRLFLTAITVFIACSALCTAAQSMWQLTGCRALQGIGAGGLMSLSLAILGDLVSPRERARYQGYILSVYGLASVLGPVLGGLLAGQRSLWGIAGWRWVFLVNLPVGLLALAAVHRGIHLPKRTRCRVRVDWPGTVVLAVGIVPLLLVAEQGRLWGWVSTRALICYSIAALGVLAFIAVEAKMSDAAIIPLRLFGNSTFAVGVAISAIVGAAMFGGIALIPQYLQVARGADPVLSGVQMLPIMFGLISGALLSSRVVARTGRYRLLPICGSTVMTLGLFLMHYLTADSPFWMIGIYMVVTGFGLGIAIQPLTMAIQNAAAPSDIGVATASATFFRQIGGTLGVSGLMALLFDRLTPDITTSLQHSGTTPAFRSAVLRGLGGTNADNADFARGLAAHNGSAVAKLLDDSTVIGRLDPVLAQPIRDGFAASMSVVVLAAAGITLVAVALTLCWKEIPLRADSALQPSTTATG